MSLTRFISNRADYRRGGLVFSAQCSRAPDGRPMIELGRLEMDRMSQANYQELLTDPAITIEITRTPGHSGKRGPKAKPAEAS